MFINKLIYSISVLFMLSMGAQLFMSQACEVNFIMGILLQNSKLNYTLWSGHVLGSYSPMLICRSADRVQISIALLIVMLCFWFTFSFKSEASHIRYEYIYKDQCKITSNIWGLVYLHNFKVMFDITFTLCSLNSKLRFFTTFLWFNLVLFILL